jgi:hypothetical protein
MSYFLLGKKMYLAYLVLSVIFCAYCCFKFRQAEGKDRRNDRLIRLHGDGSFLASIANKVMGFIWLVLGFASFVSAIWSYSNMVEQSEKSTTPSVRQEQKLQDPVPELKPEIPVPRPVIEKPQIEDHKDESDKADKASDSQG